MRRAKTGACGKLCYESHRQAKATLKRLRRIGRRELRIYYHDACDCYHLGSSYSVFEKTLTNTDLVRAYWERCDELYS